MSPDAEYKDFVPFPRSLLKTVDFTLAKDDYRFTTVAGSVSYLLGMLYLNIIILNIVIALVGDVYDNMM